MSKTYLLNAILIEEYIKEGNESLKMKQENFLLFVDEETSRPRGETKAGQNLFSGCWSQSSLLRHNFLHAVLLSRKKSVYQLSIFLVFTLVIRRPYWCIEQRQNVSQVLHNNRIKFPKEFFRYCYIHQHGRRDVT